MKISKSRVIKGIGITAGMVFFQIIAFCMYCLISAILFLLFTLFFKAPNNLNELLVFFYMGAIFAAINIALYFFVRKISKRTLNIKLEIVCAFAVYAVIFYIIEITYKPGWFDLNLDYMFAMVSLFACITSIVGFLIIWPLERRAEKKRIAAAALEQAEQPGEPDDEN